MRLSPGTGKEDCRIIDFVDAIDRVGGVISTPTLFGLDPDLLVEGALNFLCPTYLRAFNKLTSLSSRRREDETPESLAEQADLAASSEPAMSRPVPDIPKPKHVSYTDYDDPLSITPNSHIARMSANAWVACGGDIYVLECLGKGYLKVTRNEDGKPSYPFLRLTRKRDFYYISNEFRIRRGRCVYRILRSRRARSRRGERPRDEISLFQETPGRGRRHRRCGRKGLRYVCSE